MCMGYGDAVTTLVSVAKAQFALSNFMAQFVQFAGLIMFGVLSIPMGIVQDRIGRKKTLLIGLVIIFFGVMTVVVRGNLDNFYLFVLAIFLVGCGNAVLQVSGNPIMRDVSDEGQYSSNLSLGQSVKAIGSFTAPVVIFIGAWFSFSEAQSNKVLFMILAVVLALSIVSVFMLKIKEKKNDGKAASLGSCFGMLKNPYVVAMVMGIFVYVGAECVMANSLPIYFTENFGMDGGLAKQYIVYFYVAIMIGRFAGAAMLRKFNTKTFLRNTAILALVGFAFMFFANTIGAMGIAFLSAKNVTIFALFVLAFGFANIFPLIFSMAIDRIPSKANELSGLMVTAICGGAIIPPIAGFVADSCHSLLIGFTVPALAIVYVLMLGLTVSTKRENA